MLEDYQTADTRGMISAEATYSFPEVGIQVSSRSRRNNRIPSQLFRYRAVKRSLDVLAVLAAAPVLIPVFLLVACLIVLSSPGPVSTRTGGSGKTAHSFPCGSSGRCV